MSLLTPFVSCCPSGARDAHGAPLCFHLRLHQRSRAHAIRCDQPERFEQKRPTGSIQNVLRWIGSLFSLPFQGFVGMLLPLFQFFGMQTRSEQQPITVYTRLRIPWLLNQEINALNVQFSPNIQFIISPQEFARVPNSPIECDHCNQ